MFFGTPVPGPEQQPQQRQRLSLQTLIIAAVASAVAAYVTSRVWGPGTIVSAALMPVLVALVSEMLHRPADKLPDVKQKVVPKLGLAAEEAPTRVEQAPDGGQMSVYKASSEDATTAMLTAAPAASQPSQREEALLGQIDSRSQAGANPATQVKLTQHPPKPRPTYSRRNVSIRIAVVTGLIAFIVAMAAITLPEVIAGDSIFGDGNTTYFGGVSKKKPDPKPAQTTTATTTQPSTTTATTTQTTTTETTQTTTTTEPKPPTTTSEQKPQTTTTAPRSTTTTPEPQSQEQATQPQ